jgi:FAD/FMN-containing dehydrogenase/Fe-S oxidoreductase
VVRPPAGCACPATPYSPTTRPRSGRPGIGRDHDARALDSALRRGVNGEISFDPGARHLYSTDASSYRQVPIGVVCPRTVDDLLATVEICRAHGSPVTMRGGGTSLAGQATNVAVIIDCSRHLDRILQVDPEARTATVEPGVVLDDLQRAASVHGLAFGPDPSTSNRCTIGGMVGNNACGVHSVVAGRTADNVAALDVILADGTRLWAGPTTEDELGRLADRADRVGRLHRQLRDLRDEYADAVRAGFPDVPRRVSGYNLDELLPENGFHLGRALVGTEGTCAVVAGARVDLVSLPPHRAITLLAYSTLGAAGDDVPRVLDAGPVGLEGLDREVVDGVARSRLGLDPSDLLPTGEAWLVAEFGGATPEEAAAEAERFAAATGAHARTSVVTDTAAQATVWKVRKAGLGATTYPVGRGAPRMAGWEDAAVPPDRVGDYLRDLEALFDEHGLDAAVYGHFGDGCVHTKIGFDHATDEGVATYRRFVEEAADVVVGYGGSLSGEHGDGQARGELLARMYGEELVGAFRAFKAAFDPEGRMNPGKVVDARPFDADLRLHRPERWDQPTTRFAYPGDEGSFAQAAARCVGVGACRRDDGAGTMCPSYMVTHEEQHSTRGRARLLFEMLQPDSELDGWRDEHVREALDLCLSCKACSSECPVSVDMATYKAEFLHHHYEGRLRPRVAYATGLVPWLARLGGAVPSLGNAVLSLPGVERLAQRLGGTDPRRPLPRLAPRGFAASYRRRGTRRPDGRPVTLLADTFTDRFEPEVGAAAVQVLEDAGMRAELPDGWVCCGRPLYDRGMLDLASRLAERMVRALSAPGTRDRPIVVLEPSCLSVLRDELSALLPGDPDARAVAERARSLGEVLDDAGYEPGRLDRRVVYHGHCHHEAVIGTGPDIALLRASGAEVDVIDAGCCGLAGAFGYEHGEHYDVSVAAGERVLAPAVRRAGAEDLVVTDGFSCRSQIGHLVPERSGLHLAQALRLAMEGSVDPPRVGS